MEFCYQTKNNKKTTLARLFSLSLTFLASLEVLKKNKKNKKMNIQKMIILCDFILYFILLYVVIRKVYSKK